MSLINKPYKRETLKQENNALAARNALLEREIAMLREHIEDLELPDATEEIECNICELEQACDDGVKDVKHIQDHLQNEICGFDWLPKFQNKGLTDVFALLHCITQCNLTLAELCAAENVYLLQYCCAKGKKEERDALVTQLHALLEGREIDSRCEKFIERTLATC